jgi:S1-C subfamily serine protease
MGKVKVAGFPHGHAPKAGGLKVGDILLSIEDTPIHNIEDVKIDLLYREKGEKVNVRIRRKRWLLGDKEIIIEVTLSGS